MDLEQLKLELFKRGITYELGAKIIKKTKSTFTNKMSGKSLFTVVEAQDLSDYMGLSNEQRLAIFLGINLHDTQV